MGKRVDTIEPGTDVFNTQSGEVMTFVGKAYIFTMRGARPGIAEYAYGYDDYRRILEWPYSKIERV
jgi:hypothetical protein